MLQKLLLKVPYGNENLRGLNFDCLNSYKILEHSDNFQQQIHAAFRLEMNIILDCLSYTRIICSRLHEFNAFVLKELICKAFLYLLIIYRESESEKNIIPVFPTLSNRKSKSRQSYIKSCSCKNKSMQIFISFTEQS